MKKSPKRAVRAALVGAVVGGGLLISAPASAHRAYCELPWDPSQSMGYIVCVAEAEVHNNVWHRIFP